jgi:hypothetical protein
MGRVALQVRLWTVEDVCRWLDTLRLGQYKQAFKEASVDGEFLLELREEDMMQVSHWSLALRAPVWFAPGSRQSFR